MEPRLLVKKLSFHPEVITAPQKINQLAMPKGTRFLCELCDHRGVWQCCKCNVTYYCSLDHFHMDKRLKLLRRPIEFHTSSEAREVALKERRVLEDDMRSYAWKVAQTSLEEGNHCVAIAAASLSVRYAQELNQEAAHVIMPLLVISECHLHLGRADVAEAFLARALNLEREKGTIQPFVRAQIRHNEGLIHIAKNTLSEAKEFFSEEIYQNTKEFGACHIRTSSGYCFLGYAFQIEKRYHIAVSLVRKTVSIWIDTSEPIISCMVTESQIAAVKGTIQFLQKKQWMDKCDWLLGMKLVTKCYHLILENPETSYTVDTSRACYAIAALLYIDERYADAKSKVKEGLSYLSEALAQANPNTLKLLNDLLKFTERKLFREEKHIEIASRGSLSSAN